MFIYLHDYFFPLTFQPKALWKEVTATRVNAVILAHRILTVELRVMVLVAKEMEAKI